MLEGKSDAAKLEEELMSTRLREVAGFAELKELRLRVMELETQVSTDQSECSIWSCDHCISQC